MTAVHWLVPPYRAARARRAEIQRCVRYLRLSGVRVGALPEPNPTLACRCSLPRIQPRCERRHTGRHPGRRHPKERGGWAHSQRHLAQPLAGL